AREVHDAAVGDGDVVLDADAAERDELLHERPVHQRAGGRGLQVVEQVADEVDAGLDREDLPGAVLLRVARKGLSARGSTLRQPTSWVCRPRACPRPCGRNLRVT